MFTKKSLAELGRNRNGNVATMFALVSPVLVLAAGMAIDYGLVTRQKARLAMIADEASLAAVSNSEMLQSLANARTLAQNIFTSQASQLPRVTLSAGQPVVAVTTDPSGLTRTATVTYSATYGTMFAAVLGIPTLNLSGTSVAQMSTSANINFYVLLDNQGSMALPASQAGIDLLQSLTPLQNPGGCAFACHEAAPNNPTPPFGADTQGNPCQPGTSGRNCPQIDNYQLARNNNITLRFDEVASAMNDLIATASSMQSQANPAPTYQFAVYSVDAPYAKGLFNIMPLTGNYASAWASASSNLNLYTVYSDGGACATAGSNPCGAGVATATAPGGGALSYSDVGFFSSPIATEMQTLADTIPAAGDGAVNSQPREVLLVVTDGVEDTVVGNALSITAWDSNALAQCSALKNNGVKIAVLYTSYFPTPGFWLYDNYVANFQSSIGTTLQSCASANLFMTAQVGDNIAQDLQSLFQIAAQSPRLTQ